MQLLGQVLDGTGQPWMAKVLRAQEQVSLQEHPLTPASCPIRSRLDVGIRAINALLTVGAGAATWVICRKWCRKRVCYWG